MKTLIAFVLLSSLSVHTAFALERSVPLPYQYNTGSNVHVPQCTVNQYVAVNGTSFTCKTIPTCPSGQFLTFNGSAYACGAPAAAAAATPTPTPSPTPTQTCTKQEVVIGTGNCTEYRDTKCAPYGCGPGPGCPTTWRYSGVASYPGTCSRGKSTYGYNGTSFTCVEDQTVCK